MPINQAALDDVRTVLLSCLLARKGPTPLPVLERDFYDLEKKRIPYRQFGYSDLASFIQSMPDHFSIELYRGNTCVRGIASEKTQHIKSLVDRQKADNKRYVSSHSRQFYPSHNRRQHKSQRVRISHEKLSDLISYIQKSPTGVSLNVASTYVQCLVPYVEVNKEDLREQLRELTHLLNLDGNMIYPILSNDLPSTSSHSQSFMEKPSLSQSWDPSELRNDSASPPTKQTECAAGQEDDLYCSEENDFVPAGCRITRTQKRTKTSEHLATNVAYYAQSEQTDKFSYKVQNDSEISEDECFASTDSKNNITLKTQDVYNIISNRTISRLEKLLQKHPEGIWCAELPDLYYNEYNVPLNYTVLGFASVREFTFYLPKIFYMTQVNKTDDFLLFNADKRPVVPKTESTDMTQSSNKRYDKHNKVQEYNNNNEEPIPSDISPDVVKRFAPDDAMSYNDNVEKISVVELKKTKTHLEVYVIEVFHPSFFWIHLRENRKRFFKMMDELSKFYEHNKDSYAIPKVALKKDLNCACIYMNKWHRGLIKSVKPDYRVTIFFYDYGTLKTYVAEDIYYLHKQFSTLSAQAIPCGLYNVKPTTIGERWKKSVVAQFIDKIEETLLAATIMSVDEKENSMLVNLYDTSEEEDVNITNWLVYEKLALIGKTVRISDVSMYLSTEIESSTSIRTCKFRNDVDESRHCIDKSISCDKKTFRLFNVKSENKGKTNLDKFLAYKRRYQEEHNQLNKSSDAKSPSAKSVNANSSNSTTSLNAKSSDTISLDTKSANTRSELDTESSDTNSQPRNYPQNGKLRPKKILLEKFKTSNFNQKSNLNTSIPEINAENEDDARQTHSSMKIKSQNNSGDNNCYGYMNFDTRDSDQEETNDFGSFRSLYGGRGLMEPVDWSAIIENDHVKTKAKLPDNLDKSIKDCKQDIKNNSGPCEQRNEMGNSIAGKQFFLTMTRMEDEIFLPENNIGYSDAENKSDFIETLKNKTVANNLVTVMLKPNNKLKELLNSVQSENVSNLNTNVEHNDVTSSNGTDQEIDRNDKVCQTRANRKLENKNSSTDSESTIFNIFNNKNNINREMSERCENNSFESNISNKTYHSAYKLVLEKIHKQANLTNSSFVTNESSDSEQIRSSSYSCNTSQDTIISSNDEQSNQMDASTLIKTNDSVRKATSTPERLSKNPISDELHSSSKGSKNLSLETDFIVSSNLDDAKHCELNQSIDSITSSHSVDDSAYQTVINQTLNMSTIKQQTLKMVQKIEGNNTELDSDDLTSSQESINDKSDESKGDSKLLKFDSISKQCELMNGDANVTEKALAPPVLNDCDIQSDESDWDYGMGSPVLEDFSPFSIAQSQISDISD